MPKALNQWAGCSSAYKVRRRQKIYAWIKQIPTSNKIYRVWILNNIIKDDMDENIAALV